MSDHRRERGFPHRILLDECHYFLAETNSQHLLDSQLESYTLVTYRPSQLSLDVLKVIDVVAVTRLAERDEVDALRNLLEESTSSAVDANGWYEQLANLSITEAALLPPTDEAKGELRRFVVAPRLTTHVRHRTKYHNNPVPKEREFVFTENGYAVGESAATLSALSASAARVASNVLVRHSRRHDFSHWIANQFCDYDLANDIRQLEVQHRRDGNTEAFVASLSESISRRYNAS